MFIRNRQLGSLILGVALTACQASQKAQDEAIASQDTPAENARGDESEGVVGPDEAFFAALYLQQFFQYSKSEASPSLEPGSGPSVAAQTLSAFDFRANFTESRLRLMSASLFKLGDTDGDGNLSEAEFTALKLDPQSLGAPIEKIAHAYDHAFFERAAGADELLQSDECISLLRDVGPLLKADLDRLSLQDQRRQLLQAWEKVLGRYDTDHNGSLSLQEQRDLRKDRALLVSRLSGE